MTRKELNFCIELASFMCFPSAIEIGGASESLICIIQAITKKNKAIKNKVLEICFDNVSIGDFDSCAYESVDSTEVMKKIEEDYDNVFYND